MNKHLKKTSARDSTSNNLDMQQNAEPKNKSQISDYQNCWVQMKIAAT
jgi:hypothetical protein